MREGVPYELMIGRRIFRQDSQPSERIVSLEYAEHAVRNAGPADAMKAIAAGDEVAADFLLPAFVPEPDFGFPIGFSDSLP